MAQKTGLTGPPQPPRRVAEPTRNPDADGWQVEAPSGPTFPQAEPDDLGLRPVEPYQPDPTGFQPASSQVIDVAGRSGIPLSSQDLEDLHYSHAGVKPMVNDPGSLLDRTLPELSEEEQRARAAEVARRREYEQGRRRQEHEKRQVVSKLEDELLQGYSVNDQPEQPPAQVGPAVSAPAYFGPDRTATTNSSVPAQTPMPETIADIGEAGKLLESLVARAAEARARGDIKMATELNGMIQQILLASNLRRSQPKKDRHPALQKLLSNLGLERIKPVEIEWLSTKWRFSPRPETMDWWITENMGQNGIELNQAILAASLVGMDDAPLYEVFNIPLSAEYTLTRAPSEDDPGGETRISVPAYIKSCSSCGTEVQVNLETCHTCGAFLDRFDVPLELRVRYAAEVKKLFMERLCLGTEQFRHLVDLMRSQMKDRRLDQEEVFPLTQLLPKPKKTTG